MERVVITGIGLVTPVGIGTGETWRALLSGESGIGPITLFDSSQFRVRFAGEVKGWDGTRFIDKKKLKEMDRFTEFALGAASLAVADAKLELSDEERDEAGCFVGVGLGGLFTLEKTKQTLMEKGPQKISPYAIPGIIANLAAGQVSMAWGLRGPSYCTTSACSSGAHAIGEAVEWIRRGRAQVMVAGGAEATVTPVGIGGFEAMFALSRRNDDPKGASRPFDLGRDGFVCGEGSGIVILESLTRAKKRGARIYAEVIGYGASSDANHLTQPAPHGEGAQRSMKMAIKDAKIDPGAVDYINAHGTSTQVGDVAESEAIAAVFGARATDKKLPVSSTKSMMGHLLGAAGAVESAICALTIHEGKIPPTINLTDPDPKCPLDYVPNTAREHRVRYALNNSFGFGGTNASLILARFEGLRGAIVRCPFCSHLESKVTDSRLSTVGDVTRRRRECERCARRFTTYERVEEILPLVVKKDGRREPFERAKLLVGLQRACQKRGMALSELEAIVDAVERDLIDSGEKEVGASTIGERVMPLLRAKDEIAYVRFASVYRSFRDLDELRAELEKVARDRTPRPSLAPSVAPAGTMERKDLAQ